jgi:hypothetical protein
MCLQPLQRGEYVIVDHRVGRGTLARQWIVACVYGLPKVIARIPDLSALVSKPFNYTYCCERAYRVMAQISRMVEDVPNNVAIPCNTNFLQQKKLLSA